jgi:hypothetical protein
VVSYESVKGKEQKLRKGWPTRPSLLFPTERSQNVEIGKRGRQMKLRIVIALIVLVSRVCQGATARSSPASAVQELYQQVVARKPLGIPKGADRAALSPFLSKELRRKLDVAQSCEDDYFRQHAGETGKPEFDWLETGIFSGSNERGIPAAAVVERPERQKDGSFYVFVRLTYKESLATYGKTPDPANMFHWDVAAVVISEDGKFVVNDVLLFKDDSHTIESRVADSFRGCDGSRWTGDHR